MKTVQSKVQPRLLRKLNERQVLSALQAHGPMSRAEITRQTGISGPTVTRAVSALLESRLIEEDAPRAAAIGRPGKRVRLASTHVSVLGIVVGSKRCEVIAAGLDGQLASDESEKFDTPATYEQLLDACIGHARRLMGRHKSTIMGLGVSVPGLINRREGRSLVSPNLHQIDGRNLGDDLHHRLQIHATVLQECHALCLAEQVYGAAKGIADFAMLDMTEGLGLGVVHSGRLLQGASGLAGEMGHITVDLHGQPCGCGNRGCLETVATDTALVRAVNARLQTSLSIDEVVAGVQSGALAIDAELGNVLEYLAIAAAAVINIFNPSQLFIHARLLDAQEGLFERLLKLVGGRAVKSEPGRLPNDSCRRQQAAGGDCRRHRRRHPQLGNGVLVNDLLVGWLQGRPRSISRGIAETCRNRTIIISRIVRRRWPSTSARTNRKLLRGDAWTRSTAGKRCRSNRCKREIVPGGVAIPCRMTGRTRSRLSSFPRPGMTKSTNDFSRPRTSMPPTSSRLIG